MSRIRQENILSRKRVMRAHAKGRVSSEFCLANVMGAAAFRPLDFSRVGVPLGYKC
jgi:hypothetical protein